MRSGVTKLTAGPHLRTPYFGASMGSWRTHRPVIDASRCNNCLLCWLYCPEGCIRQGGQLEIDLDFCKGCGICGRECPRGAINMLEEA